jgi:fructose-1,6-bisphosphatase
MIIDCFNRSPLKNLCGIRGEENVGDVVKKGLWTLLIDPIDGSSSLVKGTDTWGSMVGLIDPKGVLRYSWNLLSTGEIFATGMINASPVKVGLKQIKNPKIDFYDYGSDQDEFFRIALAETGIKNSELTSYPAAIWAGWKLYQNKLSALIWVVGENEKKTYPDYDLIFLATLVEQGYKIRLGKLDSGKNGVVVVAPTDEDANMLYKIGFDIVSKKNTSSIKEIKNELII